MIFFKLEDYPIKDDAVSKCIEYLNSKKELPVGWKDELGDGIRVGVADYETQNSEDKKWEAHRKFADLQVMIDGSEVIELGTTSKMECGEFEEEKDFLPLFGDAESAVTLGSGYAALLMPEDAHKPGVVAFGKKGNVHKAIFKIPVNLF